MKMKNSDIMNLYGGLLGTATLTGVKFSYAVARNIKILNRIVKSIQEASAPSKIFKEYEKERLEFAQKSAIKDKNGKAVTELANDVERFVMKDNAAFEKGFEVIKEKHKQAIQERKAQIREVGELADMEIEVDLFTIPQSYIPEEINTKQMTDIMPIIKE